MIWNPFKKNPGLYSLEHEELWNHRLQALEQQFGKSYDQVGHAVIPLYLGTNVGGAADVVHFLEHLSGRLSVTADLIGSRDQKCNSLGNYELGIAHRDPEEDWGPNIISRLANYTFETVLQPRETMDIGPAAPEGSTVDAFLFYEYARFELLGQKCGVLLCVGITKKEKNAYLSGHTDKVISALRKHDVFPFTDIKRNSVV